MFVVYILKSKKTGKYYVGQTSNVGARLVRHNAGYNKATQSGTPWELVYVEKYATRSEAFRREQQIKSYKGGEALRKLLG